MQKSDRRFPNTSFVKIAEEPWDMKHLKATYVEMDGGYHGGIHDARHGCTNSMKLSSSVKIAQYDVIALRQRGQTTSCIC